MFNPSPKEIATALKSPLANVEKNYPLIRQALTDFGITKDSGVIAALATIGVEVRSFIPIDEYGGYSYFMRMYDRSTKDPERANVWRDLGNDVVGDGAKYHGRGYVQLTGKRNCQKLTDWFRSKGKNIDFVKNPDLLLVPYNAAIALAWYMNQAGTATWAEKAMTTPVTPPCSFCKFDGLLKTGVRANGKPILRRPKIGEMVCKECCWKTVRRTVNGGLNHYTEFKANYTNLMKLIKG